jgi:hypothetical protein
MIAKRIVAVLLAALVAASGAAGSFYLVGAQEQAAIEQAEITVAEEAQAGSEIDVGGSNFGANSDVSIYFMSAAQAKLARGESQEVLINWTPDIAGSYTATILVLDGDPDRTRHLGILAPKIGLAGSLLAAEIGNDRDRVAGSD